MKYETKEKLTPIIIIIIITVAIFIGYLIQKPYRESEKYKNILMSEKELCIYKYNLTQTRFIPGYCLKYIININK